MAINIVYISLNLCIILFGLIKYRFLQHLNHHHQQFTEVWFELPQQGGVITGRPDLYGRLMRHSSCRPLLCHRLEVSYLHRLHHPHIITTLLYTFLLQHTLLLNISHLYLNKLSDKSIFTSGKTFFFILYFFSFLYFYCYWNGMYFFIIL